MNQKQDKEKDGGKVVVTAALPEVLVKQLDESRKKTIRSRAGEIQARLQKSFSDEKKVEEE